MTKTVNAYKLRTNLGSYLDEVYYKKNDIIILKRGKPVVKMTTVNKISQTLPPSIKGMFKDIDITKEDIEQAKHNVFPYAYGGKTL